NYDSPQENGTEVLRRVLSNIEMINTLQPYDRARLMGWTNLSEPEKEALGWIKEPPADIKKNLNWDNLTDQQKEDIRWRGAKVDTMQVLGQMYNNELQNSINGNLLKADLSGQVEAMRSGRAREVELLTTELAALNKKKRGEDGNGGVLGELADTT